MPSAHLFATDFFDYLRARASTRCRVCATDALPIRHRFRFYRQSEPIRPELWGLEIILKDTHTDEYHPERFNRWTRDLSRIDRGILTSIQGKMINLYEQAYIFPMRLQTRFRDKPMQTINKQSRIPYYCQLADILRDIIEESVSEDKAEYLPSENELVSTYQVSRATVRQALNLLEREGLVYKTKGKGTYISKHRVRYPLTKMIATTEDMQRRGWKSSVEVISLKEVDTHSPITEVLQLKPEDKLYELCRLRLGNNDPVGIQWTYLPVKLCPGLIEHDLATSLTQVMENQFGIKFWSAHEFLRAKLPTKFEAEKLQIPKNLPVIYMERTTFSPEGRPVEFLQSVWRSDKYEYEFSLTRSTE